MSFTIPRRDVLLVKVEPTLLSLQRTFVIVLNFENGNGTSYGSEPFRSYSFVPSPIVLSLPSPQHCSKSRRDT